MLIEHRLDFTKDWLAANTSFRMGRIGSRREISDRSEYTATGHLDNHFSVGPAILWSPFLVVAHGGVLLYDHFGGQIPADGFSKPYLWRWLLGTALYGFLALLISFLAGAKICFRALGVSCHAGHLVREFAAGVHVLQSFVVPCAVGLHGGAVSLVLDSHARGADVVAMDDSRGDRRADDGCVLRERSPAAAAAAGIARRLLESVQGDAAEADRRHFLRERGFRRSAVRSVSANAGHKEDHLRQLLEFRLRGALVLEIRRHSSKSCFSADHGLFSWTPILILAADRAFHSCGDTIVMLALYSIAVFAAYLYAIGCYQDWDGLSSFGNRFFVSLTPIFVLGSGGVLRLARTRVAANGARSIVCRERDRGLDSVESGPHLSVGHASDSGARPDFLARRRA